jgi:hypothetical protein
MSFTDFQNDCIQKAKDQLHLIPRIEHVIRWKDMPGKVSTIVRLQKSSALSIAEFSEKLKISSKALSNFTKGKDHFGKEWQELLILVNPKQFKAKVEKMNTEKADIAVSDKILAILNRDMIKGRGLRDETIKVELKSTKPRFVSTVLNKLLKNGKVQRFIDENKKVMWKIPEDEAVTVKSSIELIIPEVISSNKEVTQEIQFPSENTRQKPKKTQLQWAWDVVLANIEPEQIQYINSRYDELHLRVSLKGSCLNFPYEKWRHVLIEAVEFFPKLCKHIANIVDNQDWYDDTALLKAIRATQKEKNFKSEQEVIDHFEELLSLGNVKIA